MSDTESKLHREVQELRAEVRRLKHLIEGGFVAGCLAIAVIFPRSFGAGGYHCRSDFVCNYGFADAADDLLVFSSQARWKRI